MAISSRVVIAALLVALSVNAQFGVFRNLGHTPQAETQEEFDLYLEIIAEQDPARSVRKVEEFARRYAESELLGNTWQYQMSAYEQLGDLDGVLEAGRKVLPRLPDNVATLLTMASAIPNATAGREDAAELLAAAEEYARRALHILERKQIPREIPFAEWRLLRARMEAQAHEALGHVAAKRGDLETAVTEFQTAVERHPKPEGRQFFRLGVAYAWVGRRDQARSALEKAAGLGPDLVRRLALEEMKKLDENP